MWYVIGREDLKNGLMHGWLPALANKTGKMKWNKPVVTIKFTEYPASTYSVQVSHSC